MQTLNHVATAAVRPAPRGASSWSGRRQLAVLIACVAAPWLVIAAAVSLLT